MYSKIFKKAFLLTTFTLLFTGCALFRPAPQGETIRMGKFQCDDPLLAQMFERMVAMNLQDWSTSEIIFEGEAPCHLDGIVYRNTVSSSSGVNVSFTAKLVEGVSVTVRKDGQVLDSAVFFQQPKKSQYLTAQQMANAISKGTLQVLVDHDITYKK